MNKQDIKTIVGYNILYWVNIKRTLYPVIELDIVREFINIDNKPIILFDKSISNEIDKEYSDKKIFRMNGELSQKDFNILKKLAKSYEEKIAPNGSTKYNEYYFK